MLLEKPPPLGQRVPNVSHAISVQMPTWQDMCDMALGDPRVKQVQENGYPRSFLHRDIERLIQIFRKDYLHLSKDNSCLVFSNLKSAKSCLDFLVSSLREDDRVTTQICRLHGFQFSKRSEVENRGALLPKIYVVAFPTRILNKAMIFWRLTGTGVSSRLAVYWLESADPLNKWGSIDASDGGQGEPWTEIHEAICERILGLLQRASLEPSRATQLSKHDVFLYQSGMSAIYHVHHLLLQWKGLQSIVFGFPYELTLKMLQTYGPGCTFYPFGIDDEISRLERVLEDQTSKNGPPQALWCECPSNPLLRTPNLGRLRKLADHYGFALVVDDTIGSFANVDLLGIADITITSLTKSFSGYSNVMAGSVVLNPTGQHYGHLSDLLHRKWRNDLFVEDAIQLEMNSRNFLQRVNQINMSTSELVKYFEPLIHRSQSILTAVYYPEVCWSTENYRAQMRHQTADFVPGYGGVFTLEFSSVQAASTFFNASNIHKGPSLGANLTLMQPYVQTVFFKEKEWAAQNGVKETIVRISVGLEDPKLLLETFRAAIAEADKTHSNTKIETEGQNNGLTGQGLFRGML